MDDSSQNEKTKSEERKIELLEPVSLDKSLKIKENLSYDLSQTTDFSNNKHMKKTPKTKIVNLFDDDE